MQLFRASLFFGLFEAKQSQHLLSVEAVGRRHLERSLGEWPFGLNGLTFSATSRN